MNNEVSIVLDVISTQSYIYLVVNNEIKQLDVYENKNNLSNNLIGYINTILLSHQYTLQSINKIYLVYGPGKFSAMRIATTVAKTLSLLNRSKLYIIDKFDYLNASDGWVVIKSDGTKSFICHYSNNQKDTQPQLVDDSEVKNYINADEIVTYESDNQHNLLRKLNMFQEVDCDFELEYLKKPC